MGGYFRFWILKIVIYLELAILYFEFLKNYVRIENTRYPNFKKQDYKEKYTTAKREPVMVDLNSATYEDLLEIRGIGPSFANRIIRYRDLLGGFISCEQLKEVYGIDEEKYSSVKDQVKADPAQINKININNATYKDLIRMPYFNKKTARDFIEYVKITGKVKEVKSLLKDNIVDEEIFKKMGCNDFISKPIDFDIFYYKLYEFISKFETITR